jgi:hypothetical protein
MTLFSRPTESTCTSQPAGESPTDAFEQGPGGGVAVLARNPRSGTLVQPRGRRGCINRRGTRGCRRDRRIGMRERLAISPDGRWLYSTNAYRGEGPRVSPITPDGSVHPSRASGSYPAVAAGLAAIGTDARGRVYASSTLPGFFVYAPTRSRSRLRMIVCWTEFPTAPCRRKRGLGTFSSSSVAPQADGPATYVAGEGILTFVR